MPFTTLPPPGASAATSSILAWCQTTTPGPSGVRPPIVQPPRTRPSPSHAVFGSNGGPKPRATATSPVATATLSRFEDSGYVSRRGVDADLWQALDYCEDTELEAVHDILFGPSPFSPVVKNIVVDNEPPAVSYRGRTSVMQRIESRFRFLAADSLATLQGYRPSYREALVHMRHRLKVGCPSDLTTSDLEAEIFLHLLKHYAEYVQEGRGGEDAEAAAVVMAGDGMGSVRPKRLGQRWFERIAAPLKFGGKEMASMLTKLGGVVTVAAMRNALLQDIGTQMAAKRLKYQAALKLLYSEGMSNLKKQAAVQVRQQYIRFIGLLELDEFLRAAHRGLTSTAVHYSTVRSVLSMLGPLMWSWLCVDLAMKSVGTDYSRIVKTVFALAQVRLLRTYGFSDPTATIEEQLWDSAA